MLVAKLIVKNVRNYELISKLTEYSYDDTVSVDIYDRCHVTVPSSQFTQCLGMLYRRNEVFDVINYLQIGTDED